MNFTHLHLHTEYSLLDGANKIKSLAKKIKSLGMNSVAISDHGNMFGAIDFYTTMKKEGIKPIIGIEAYIHNHEKLDDKSTKQRFHVCLFAKNYTGYKNLMYLSSMSYLKGFYYYPRINKDLLFKYSEGIICTSACLQGEINWHLNLNNEKNKRFGAKGYEEAKKIALEYKEVFKDDFYLEIMRHGISDQRYVDDLIIKLSLETGIKLIVTNDTHYLEKKDAPSHEAFMCIAMNKTLDDPNRLKHSVHEFYVKSPEEIYKLYSDIPEAIENTQEIVDKCNLEIPLGNPTPPNFKFTINKLKELNLEIEEDNIYSFKNDTKLFKYLSRKGLEERLKTIDKTKHKIYKDRLEKEIDIIVNMKFPGYMLIVWDFVNYAKSQNIPVGPGRGSAAGSLVSYSLKITDIDPLPYGLLFERFLNPERVSMPDIDMDFCQNRRQEVIDYVIKQYGRENVAQIITFGKLLAKGVIRDVARVLGVAYSKADAMAKLIPDELGITLEKAYEKEPKLKELINTDKIAKDIWTHSLALEGLNRNAGTHAAGVVISNEPLWNKTPLFKPTGVNTIATQYSGKYIEDVDLIKFDFLGLKTLTVIDETAKLVKKLYNKTIEFNKLDVNDKKVYDLIKTGNTLGIFQIESTGMQDLAKRLKPSNFEDIIAMLALYRPGPMESGMLDDFIDRKHGKKEINYFFDEFTKPLKPILEPTYGVIVYQEQVMQIVQVIGGFSLGGADLVRRAMGKKIKEEMDRLKDEFIKGGVKNGYNDKNCASLFDLIVKFAGYGFNKSHSAAYGLVTFYTAYLKTYYPMEFMSALLTLDKDNPDKVVKYIDETKRLKFELFGPNINKSHLEFAPAIMNNKKVLMFGLGALKGAGEIAINSILKVRDTPFKDLNDFLSRIDSQKVNKKVIETLIKAGAFNEFGYSRKALLEQIDKIIDTLQKTANIKKLAQNSLFGNDDSITNISIKLENMPEFELKKLLEIEKESLGFYLSGHPLDEFKDKINKINYTLSSDIENCADGDIILLVGKIESIDEKFNKKGNKFYIANILDFHGNIDLMLFEDKYQELQKLDLNIPIAFKVKILKNEQFTRKSLLKIETLEEASKENVKKVTAPKEPFILELDFTDNISSLENLYKDLQLYQGDHKLILLVRTKLANIKIETNFFLDKKVLELKKYKIYK